MKAYFIANIAVTDPETYKSYTAQAPATIEAHGGRYLVRGGAHETMEGDWKPNRIVVLEFPDMATAKGWYNSPEYQEIVGIRHASTTGSSILIEGLAPPV
ncbi:MULTISPECIES: DUF1330 domain-containing protein [unclassified Hwanghaeella]|jgi:uncharacterized protein (DUF1330 family)|uniref:DUF1330 domain-containing protein n=1 Tax=unclassified Hwanghaeella TaxID=2605944 RepID=UPI000C8AAAA0|nr:D-fructose-6-phosphate amidotransferase [Rhodospirillales bacterium]|tara:strand:- start:22063 stop:22362 length:300 start_codon:yes stop_codon:yes gene_type:complete